MAKKKRLDEVVVEEVVEEYNTTETIEVTIEPVCESKCDGMVQVKITDQFVKYKGIVYKKWETPYFCKEVAQNANWCKILN